MERFEEYPNTKAILCDRFQTDDFVKRNSRLVHEVIKNTVNWCIGTDQHEDYIQVGLIGLYNAMKTYSPEMKNTFATYAYPIISNELLVKYKYDNRILRKPKYPLLYLNQPVTIDGDCKMEFIDMFSSNTDVEQEGIAKVQNPETIKRIKKNFTKTQLKILHYLLLNKDQTEIANILGCKRQNVNNSIKSMRQKIVRYIN